MRRSRRDHRRYCGKRDFNRQYLFVEFPPFPQTNHGPNAPELLLGALGSCMSTVFIAIARRSEVSVKALETKVSREIDTYRNGRTQYPGGSSPDYPVPEFSAESWKNLLHIRYRQDVSGPIDLNLMDQGGQRDRAS